MRNNMKAIVAVAMTICVTMLIGRNVFATDNHVLLTESQVKNQAKTLMDEARNRDDDFAVLSYDIADIYTTEGLGYMINDYRSGQSVSEMLQVEKAESEAIMIETITDDEIKESNICDRVWYLPYKTQTNQNAVAYLYEMNGKLVLAGGGVKPGSTFNLKIKEGQYEEIPMEDVAETRYISMGLYNIRATYVRMKDGTEYMIPFMSENVKRFNHLEDGKVYEVDDFYAHMHNYYDEPTMTEVRQAKAEYERTGTVSYSGSGVPLREVPLNQMNRAKQGAVCSMLYGIVSIGSTIVLIYLLRKWHMEKKISNI